MRAECVGGSSAGPGGHTGWGALGQSALGLFHMPESVGGGNILPHSEALGEGVSSAPTFQLHCF